MQSLLKYLEIFCTDFSLMIICLNSVGELLLQGTCLWYVRFGE